MKDGARVRTPCRPQAPHEAAVCALPYASDEVFGHAGGFPLVARTQGTR
jgi:hypothetical protein